METYPEGAFGINSEELEVAALSHEDLMPYDEQALPSSTAEPDAPSLANRIGTTKVYLTSEAVSGVTRAGKVRR